MKNIKTLAVILGSLTLGACSTVEYTVSTKPEVSNVSHVETGQSVSLTPLERNAVNPQLSSAQKLASITAEKTPTLKELQSLKAPEAVTIEESEEDKLRLPAMRDTALAYGARGGLSFASWQINKMLQGRSNHLDEIYNFNRLLIRGPNGSTVLPPVISEARNAYEVNDLGKSIRVADQVFEIIEQSRFSPTAPLWHTYLIRDYSSPKEPNGLILPKNKAEQEYWSKYIQEGWNAGVKQANEIFQADLNRLDRDYQGMIRYTALLSEGKVSAPIISKGDLGVTGDGENMRVNDSSIRIMKDPELITDYNQWSPTINYEPPSANGDLNKKPIANFPRPVIRRY